MKTTLSALHHQGNDWNRDLDFYVDELAILTKRLQQVKSKKATPATLVKADGFLKKFIKIREKADALKLALKIREKKVDSIAEDNPGEIYAKLSMVNDRLFDKMNNLSKEVAGIRYSFNQFLVKALL